MKKEFTHNLSGKEYVIEKINSNSYTVTEKDGDNYCTYDAINVAKYILNGCWILK